MASPWEVGINIGILWAHEPSDWHIILIDVGTLLSASKDSAEQLQC